MFLTYINLNYTDFSQDSLQKLLWIPRYSADICKINPIAKNRYSLAKNLNSKIPKIKCAIASPIELRKKWIVFATYFCFCESVFIHADPLLQYHVCNPISLPKKCLKNPITNNNK